MTQIGNIILDQKQIDHKIRRIAYQIYENNVSEKEVVIAGIFENGFVFAKKIKTVIEKISPIKVIMCKVMIDKKNPIEPITTSLESKIYKNKSLVLVDDVLHSGTTLIYGIKHFLQVPLKQFNTAVLVDRNHKKYPVKADFKGISLSTSINENVSVVFEKGNYFARLD
ncbi:phosphoribosyltransferase family protein [Flavobacteriaceae bacterium]|jgi:pyrimidine operon attenuation protein/uracil phosphoribosyltransferase|nr:phosphoribosyltransferase [Flavobacteriaceae bacterium]MDA7549543.1 phosphoribosyltransferase family protein [Flavobacteriaceae bacterium]|tara:strand:- start:195 stop:698 length:504 start_codon:yes stop_codon:yes gene_type:complete